MYVRKYIRSNDCSHCNTMDIRFSMLCWLREKQQTMARRKTQEIAGKKEQMPSNTTQKTCQVIDWAFYGILVIHSIAIIFARKFPIFFCAFIQFTDCFAYSSHFFSSSPIRLHCRFLCCIIYTFVLVLFHFNLLNVSLPCICCSLCVCVRWLKNSVLESLCNKRAHYKCE